MARQLATKPGDTQSLLEDTAETEPDESSGDEEEDGYLDFEEVLIEEQDCIQSMRNQRHADGRPGQPFSLAFSGGGIRAAAFQCGILWRLAQTNRLKDVEYFTAVSGGGYITSAFASHCAAAEPPEPGKVRDWYIDVVAKTVCRMQTNAGDFVRDCVGEPGWVGEGAGCLPRVCDLPILIVTLLVTLLINPFMFLVTVIVPGTLLIEVFFGNAMRQAFCASRGTWWSVFKRNGPFHFLQTLGLWSLILLFAVFCLRKLLPPCKLRKIPNRKRPYASRCYLLGHSAGAFLIRFTVFVFVFSALIVGTSLMQILMYDANPQNEKIRTDSCQQWMMQETSHNRYSCSFDLTDASTASLQSAASKKNARSIFGLFWTSLVFAFVFSICLLPIFGSELFLKVVALAGPLFIACIWMALVSYRVFAPLTHNALGKMPWSSAAWKGFVTFCLIAQILLVPFYAGLRSLMHQYYKDSLRKNFYADGQDNPISDLAGNPYCPYVIMTGTSSDFKPPGDKDTISEVSFSALHCGSEETGYVPMPEYRSLSKCTAITGAGCLDAISLSMNDALSMRFWLEVLNLSWGDYVTFEPKGAFCGGRAGKHAGQAQRFLHVFPSSVILFVIAILMFVGWLHINYGPPSCTEAAGVFKVAMFLVVVVLAVSFFTWVPLFSFMSLSPIVRQFLQATKFSYVGQRPPRMLYMTDGGVRDCTSIVQLLWRRRERILLVLAAADPRDELGVLKAAMKNAEDLQLASFYDPRDPRRSVSVLLSEFKGDKNASFLHIGISYCFEHGVHSNATGHLYIVKNRLPQYLAGQPVRPLLSEEEIRGECGPDVENFDEEAWGDMTTDQLGPFGCCDCCHTNGLNCGPKFPHGTFTGYLYLTPEWCSSLARLGYQMSEQVVQEIFKTGSLARSWEDHVDR